MHIKNEPIINPQFLPLIPDNLEFNDIVVIYNDGEKWKIVPYNVLKKHLILYDNIYSNLDKNNKTRQNCTLTYCPYTQSVVLYKKHLLLSDEQNDKNLLLVNPDTNQVISQLTNNTIVKDDVYRDSVKHVISEFRDSLYLHYHQHNFITDTKKLNKEKNTPIHGIEYVSKNVDKNGKQIKKHIMVLNDKPISILLHYIDSLNPEITEKDGIIIPSTKIAWETYFPDTKVVRL